MSIFAMLGMDGQSLIVYHYISILCIVVEKYFGIIKENSLIINLSNFLHREVIDNQYTTTYNTICPIMSPLPAPKVMDLLFNFNAF